MLLRSERRVRRESGQAIILFVVAMGIVLVGALGLAIDGSQLYAHRQILQGAVDSAAQAGIMSVFNKTNTGANAFGNASFTCTSADDRTPCFFARENRVGASADDVIVVDFPGTATGVTLSTTDTPNLITVTATRTVHNGLIRLVAPALSTVRATATAAIVDVVAPTPILVLHPSLSGSLSANGNPTITICGGPRRSIQINSRTNPTNSFKGGPNINLSHAGPLDPGNCTTGTGGDYGTFGGPAARPSQINVGSAKYIQPSSPILDPLATVPAPAVPAAAPAKTNLANGVSGCPASPGKPCKLYSPGLYASGIDVKNETAVFKPGIYYMQSDGFQGHANGDLYMSTGFPNDPVTGQGMLVYITGNSTDDIVSVGANGSVSLTGTPSTSIYKGILFFSQHTSTVLKQHSLGGGGALALVGTIYLANTLALTTSTPAVYQQLSLQGNPGSATNIIGQIVVDALNLGGNAGITMTLSPNATLHIRQIALVN